MGFIFFAGCSHTVEKKVKDDIAAQTETSPNQAVNSGREAIVTSNQLSIEQKEKLLDLMDQTRQKIRSIRRNESQTKASLFKYIASGKFEDLEIRVYQKKLTDLENQKMDLMFSNIQVVRKILGNQMIQHPDLMDLLDYERLSTGGY